MLTVTSFYRHAKAFRQLLSNYHQDNRGALAAYALLEGGDHAENLLDDLVSSPSFQPTLTAIHEARDKACAEHLAKHAYRQEKLRSWVEQHGALEPPTKQSKHFEHKKMSDATFRPAPHAAGCGGFVVWNQRAPRYGCTFGGISL